MSAHLLALSVGPVQEFIAAARRTRDLWFGSYLLSEIGKATAKSVQDRGGKLIFPAPDNDADLDPDSALNVPNLIVAELREADPATVAREARTAARNRWRSFADQVFDPCIVRADIWKDQADDVIEFYAAWRAFSPQSYQADRASLMRLLAARKRCRDFSPAKGRAGVPKSSLDGLRESVLGDRSRWPAYSRRSLRLSDGEQLDIVGVLKRSGAPEGGAPRYPSVARVAADPWLRRIPPAPLAELAGECRKLGSDVIHEIDISGRRGYPQYAAFPFDGTSVFRSRHRDLCAETELSDSELQPLVKALDALTRDHGKPSPYLGVLVADGDRIGEAISRLPSPDDHRKFSRALARFSADARKILDAHSGVLVYAGGDDVLAFVPVDRCLGCARALYNRFREVLKNWSNVSGAEPTLSIGVAIAHFMEPLEDLLGYGRNAEDHAKHPRNEDEGRERNGVAVHLVKRGGGPIAVRASWSANPDEHLERLARWIDAATVSGRIAYDLRKIADTYDSWPDDIVGDAIRRDTLSVLQGKQPGGASSSMQDVANLIRTRVKNARSLRGLANDLLIAKAIPPAKTASPVAADSP